MAIGDTTSDEVERVCKEIVDAAFQVHQRMKAGLLESVYEACLAFELRRRGLRVETQVPVPVVYDGVRLEIGFRLDMLIEDPVVIELKSVERIEPIFQAVLQNYLRLTNKRVGFLINFNVQFFKDGIKRIVL